MLWGAGHGQQYEKDFGSLHLMFGGDATFHCPAFQLVERALSVAQPVESGWLSAVLGGSVHLKWQQRSSTLLLTVTSLVKAQWVAIAFGKGMVGADAILAWVGDGEGAVRVQQYKMTSLVRERPPDLCILRLRCLVSQEG